MGQTIGDNLPLAIGIAVFPVPIIAPLPKWMAALGTFTPVRALAVARAPVGRTPRT